MARPVVASNSVNPNSAPIADCSSGIIYYTGGINPIEAPFAVPNAYATGNALYFIANDWLHQRKKNNDYLLYELRIRVPEPARLGIVGIGLAVLTLKRRKT